MSPCGRSLAFYDSNWLLIKFIPGLVDVWSSSWVSDRTVPAQLSPWRDFPADQQRPASAVRANQPRSLLPWPEPGGWGGPARGGREGGREGGVSDGVPQEEGGERRSGPFITMDLSRWLYSNAKKLSGKVRDFDLASPPASSTPPPLGCSFQKVMEGGCWRKGPGLG